MAPPHPVWFGHAITIETMPQTLGFPHLENHLGRVLP